jgi:hypothetical protein
MLLLFLATFIVVASAMRALNAMDEALLVDFAAADAQNLALAPRLNSLAAAAVLQKAKFVPARYNDVFNVVQKKKPPYESPYLATATLSYPLKVMDGNVIYAKKPVFSPGTLKMQEFDLRTITVETLWVNPRIRFI